MSPVAKRKDTDDPRTVAITNDDTGDHEKVTPEAADALEHYGWTRDDATGDPNVDKAVKAATAPLEARIAELEQQLAATTSSEPAGDGMPDRATDLIDWIGEDPDRAAQAHTAETARPEPRKSVLEHIEALTRKGA